MRKAAIMLSLGVAGALLVMAAGELWAACCPNLKHIWQDASCSGVAYTACKGATCELHFTCPPPQFQVNCEDETWYCLGTFFQVEPHGECTGQNLNTQCYKDGTYKVYHWTGGSCARNGCNQPTPDDGNPHDNWNTEPCP